MDLAQSARLASLITLQAKTHLRDLRLTFSYGRALLATPAEKFAQGASTEEVQVAILKQVRLASEASL